MVGFGAERDCRVVSVGVALRSRPRLSRHSSEVDSASGQTPSDHDRALGSREPMTVTDVNASA